MDEWSLPNLDGPLYQFDTYQYPMYPQLCQDNPVPQMPHCQPPQAQPAQPVNMAMHLPQLHYPNAPPKGDNPRESRNRAEKMRRDKLNQSVAELAAIVPPVVAARRKVDKTTVLRLTAHYLRAHQHVFGDSAEQSTSNFTPAATMKVLNLFNGFLITTTYRGIIVVTSQNVHKYLGYTEIDLLGQNLLNYTHEDDRALLREQLMPKTQTLGHSGELVIPNEPGATRKASEELAEEKRSFVLRLKKAGQRSEPKKYVWCHIQGSLRKSDRVTAGSSRNFKIVRRARARSENPCSSGNDVVFIGIVRPTSETFINESALEGYRMEYRTRHSIDGEIIQCESRMSLVTGYMMHEVSGVNAMNFMHRDDVRWVIIALREMYDKHRIYGESCYRLMAKNGQFIYMRTRGRLDVDPDSRSVTSFVCTNTVVNEEEGKHLIKMMKNKFQLLVNNNERAAFEEEIQDVNFNKAVSVEDPKRLEQVIMHLVTNLPSPATNEIDPVTGKNVRNKSVSPSLRLNIIPPNKERIVSAIEKIYNVINISPKNSNQNQVKVHNTIETKRNVDNFTAYASSSTDFLKKEQDEYWNNMNVVNDSYCGYIPGVENRMLPAPIEPRVKFEDETFFNAESHDLAYFGSTPQTYNMPAHFSDSNMNPYFVQQHNMMPEVKSHYDEISDLFQPLDEPNFSSYVSGTKRPNEYEYQDVTYKKKIADVIQHTEPTPSCESPTLESLFDEAMFNPQIESAINSLDTIDPTFPDLLISTNDVQDILGQIENNPQDTEININEFHDFV